MTDAVVCLIALIVITGMVITLVWFGRMTETGNRSRLRSIREGIQALRDAQSFSEILFVFFAYSSLILRIGYWGMLTAVGAAGYSAVAAVCGVNPWPYIRDILRDLYGFLSGQEVHTPT